MGINFKSRATGFLTALVLSATLAQSGCWSDSSLPELSPEPYSGPALSLEAVGGNYLVVLNAPTPGYSMLIDRSEQERAYREIFVTVRKPNPQFAYAQMMVTQRAATGVDTKQGVKVYARFLDHLDAQGAYRLVVSSEFSKP
ncbi:MAG: hypothetical protein ACK54H_05555 [Phycisphaerales bacterium]